MRAIKTPSPPFVDEVSLFEDLLQNRVNYSEVKFELSEVEINEATATLYSLMRDRHKDFINALDACGTRKNMAHKPIKILVVPGMFYKENLDSGADGMLTRDIAKKFSFEVELVETQSRGSVLVNKNTLRDKILSDKHENIWLVSYSKGSTEARMCLEELMLDKFPSNIKGWISISGLIKGSPLCHNKIITNFSRTLWYVSSLFLGVDYCVAEELSHKNQSLKKKILLPPHLKIIHIAGFPLSSHLQPILIKWYERLSVSGPNDGVMPLRDLLEIPGHVYPIWGVDHFLKTSSISELTYKLCNYIINYSK